MSRRTGALEQRPERIGFRDEGIEPPYEHEAGPVQDIKSGLFSVPCPARELPITARWLKDQALSNLSTALILAGEAMHLWEAGLADAAREKFESARHSEWQGLLHTEKLSELAAGSLVWQNCPPVRPTDRNLQEYADFCDQLIQALEASGELADREALFTERNTKLHALWREWNKFVTHEELADYTERKAQWQPHWDELYDQYLRRAQDIGERGRPWHERQCRTLERPASVLQPGRHSTPSVIAPITQTLFAACHVPREEFQPSVSDNRAGMGYGNGENQIRVDNRLEPPAEITNAYVKQEDLRAWIHAGEEGKLLTANLSQLDEMAWDVAALAVTAFYTRTDGETPNASFPLLIDDYFDWRNVPANHRTRDTRFEIRKRIELLASDAVKIVARTTLHLPNPKTGRKELTPIITRGAYLDGKTEFWIAGQAALPNLTDDPPDGYLTRLGGWAAPFVKPRAMIGLALRQLAEYNLRTQQWERRIGWYLTFQMNIQASKMGFTSKTHAGKTRTLVTPQHGLKMETVLDGAHVPNWREIARVNPGRLVDQWVSALTQLCKDRVIARPECAFGSWDGTDLKTATGRLKRGGLATMQRRVYLFRPDGELLEHVQSKNEIATAKRKEAARCRTARK